MWIGCVLKRLLCWTFPASLLLRDRASYSCGSNLTVVASFCLCWVNFGSILLHPDLSSTPAPTKQQQQQKNIICHWVCLPLAPPEFYLKLGPSLVKQRGVKRSLENAWKNTCSFLSVIYSVHKVRDSPFKGCKSPRKTVLNDLQCF